MDKVNLEPGIKGTTEIKNFELTEAEVKIEKISALFNDNGSEVYDLEPGHYTKLIGDGQIQMSNTPMEFRTNQPFFDNANGNVLIAGLGIGMILFPLDVMRHIKSFTVIEKSQEVIDLVKPQLNLNTPIEIIQGDIKYWRPENGKKYETIYFDIWPTIEDINYIQMKWLHSQFRKYLNKQAPNFWMDSWRLKDCKKQCLEDGGKISDYKDIDPITLEGEVKYVSPFDRMFNRPQQYLR